MICPYCGNKAEWVSNDVIYGKRFGKSYMCYYCKPCDAYVGCHKNSHKALGTMANRELRKLRMEAHKAFDVLWKSGLMTRKEAYALLSTEFSGREMHIGESDEKTCKKIIKVCTPETTSSSETYDPSSCDH